ncbi:MAG: transposase [Verrucomicrobia bacterium]|nr:transposase [Verrucomicrobiota bacterium]
MSIDLLDGVETKEAEAGPGQGAGVGNRGGAIWKGRPWPANLAEWMPEGGLADLIVQQARDEDDAAVRPAFSLEASRLYAPWMVLALVAYAYSHGVYGSLRVAELARRDRDLQRLFHDQVPNGKVIQWFRDRNRAVIQRFLARVMAAMALRGSPVEDGAVWCRANDCEEAATGSFAQWIAGEAKERLRRAEREDVRAADPPPT